MTKVRKERDDPMTDPTHSQTITKAQYKHFDANRRL